MWKEEGVKLAHENYDWTNFNLILILTEELPLCLVNYVPRVKQSINNFYRRIVIKTNILFSKEELYILNKGL